MTEKGGFSKYCYTQDESHNFLNSKSQGNKILDIIILLLFIIICIMIIFFTIYYYILEVHLLLLDINT